MEIKIPERKTKIEKSQEQDVYKYAERSTFPIKAKIIVFNGVHIITGKGSPLNVIRAPLGSLYLNQSGGANTSIYVKESQTAIRDATGWTAK